MSRIRVHTKGVRQIGTVLLWIIIVLLFLNGLAKFSMNELALTKFVSLGLESAHMRAIGLIEMVIALVMVFRPTRRIGYQLATAYLGGAIGITLLTGGRTIVPLAVLLAMWFAHWLIEPYWCRCILCKGPDCPDCKEGMCDRHEMCHCSKHCRCVSGNCDC